MIKSMPCIARLSPYSLSSLPAWPALLSLSSLATSPLSPRKKPLFSIIKAFAYRVILATGFVHVLLDVVECLEFDCLLDNLWHEFPF